MPRGTVFPRIFSLPRGIVTVSTRSLGARGVSHRLVGVVPGRRCPGVHVSRLHRGVLASALTQGRPREDGVHNALWYKPLGINAIRLDERARYLSPRVGYHPFGLKVADMPRVLRRCHNLLLERATTRQLR